MAGSATFGVLRVVHEEAINNDTIRFLELLASQVAVALENLSIVEAERQARRHSTVLLNAVRDLAATLSITEVLRQTLAYCQRVFDCQQYVILLYRHDELTGGLSSVRGWVAPISSDKMQDIYLRSQVLTSVVTHRNTRIIQDVTTDPDWIAFPSEKYIHSWMGVPLVVRGEVVGVLSLYHTQTDAFTNDHRELAEALATHAGLAIENARLYQHMEQQADLLEELVVERTG